MTALAAAAAFLRFSDLSDWWLNPDEGIYYSILTRGSSAGFWQEVLGNAHPPLYYLLLRLFGFFTGDFFWLRALSVASGVAALVGVWAVAGEMASSERTGEGPDGPSPDGGRENDASTHDVHARALVAGLVAASVFAFSPGPVRLSQVIRPYMLALAFLAWGLFFLLRYARRPSDATLAGYLTLACLALLTHYSSALALGTFALVALAQGLDRGAADVAWRRLMAWHALPFGLLALLYLVHIRPLAATTLADEALDGWLSYFMIDGPVDAWWSLLGLQHHLAGPWLRGPLAIFMLAAVGLAACRRAWSVLAVAGGSLVVAVTGAAVGLYPLGATRHSAWLLVFVVPGLGWLAALVLDAPVVGRRRLVLGAATALLVFGGPVGSLLGTANSRWAPTERVLRDVYLRAMLPELDPSRTPELIVMSDQTFYLLLPFYPAQREDAVFASDSTAFHFPYGDRTILVNRTWDFDTLAGGPPQTDLSAFLRRASTEFEGLGIRRHDEILFLSGGWGLPIVGELQRVAGDARVVRRSRVVPGLHAFVLGTEALLEG